MGPMLALLSGLSWIHKAETLCLNQYFLIISISCPSYNTENVVLHLYKNIKSKLPNHTAKRSFVHVIWWLSIVISFSLHTSHVYPPPPPPPPPPHTHTHTHTHRDPYMRQWIGSALAQIMACAYSAPSHYLNQCRVNVNWTITNKLQWNFNQNTNFSFTKMHLKIPSAKWRPFCPWVVDELNISQILSFCCLTWPSLFYFYIRSVSVMSWFEPHPIKNEWINKDKETKKNNLIYKRLWETVNEIYMQLE